MMHNAIDRFTGGVREHMLSSEELIWKKEIEVHLTLWTPAALPTPPALPFTTP